MSDPQHLAAPESLREGFASLASLAQIVHTQNACALPGCSVIFERFIPVMRRAVSRGYVHTLHADFVEHGLTHGFDLGFSPDRLARRGRRIHRPYASAVENSAAVASAVWKRVHALKTVVLGEWRDRPHDIPFDDCLCFPCGAVEKNPLYAPGEFRPVSDHTKSGFNGACLGDIYTHVLNTHKEVTHFLKSGYVMLVSDVDGAFPILPLAPSVWPYMLFLVTLFAARNGARRRLHLCCNVFADFGTRFAPGAFYIFFVKVVLQMARSEMLLTLAAVVHVDDLALIGECAVEVDAEGERLTEWTERVAGVAFKVIKTLPAATRQLYVGLWWDSNTRCLELEERRLRAYISLLFDFASRGVLSLQERQSVAGKMQRAILTLPPGARCLISATYGLTMGLLLPWQRRRTTRLERTNFRTMGELLEANGGRGWFDRSHLPWAPPIYSDACKSNTRAGGGFVSADGTCHWQPYGRAASRRVIDELEGDWVELACERMCHKWKGMRVPFGIDNQAFQKSQAAARSRAHRLAVIIRRLFFLQLKYNFVLEGFWVSSEDNLLADLLSRNDIERFWHEVSASGFWDTDDFVAVRTFADAGAVRTMGPAVTAPSAGRVSDPPPPPPDLRRARHVSPRVSDPRPPPPDLRRASRDSTSIELGTASSNIALPGDYRHASRSRTMPQRSTVPHARASMWDGLPSVCQDQLEEIMDHRLGASSLRSMMCALKFWVIVCTMYSFDVIIQTDDPLRGGKATALVLYMVRDTKLVWASIENYIWAWREWMVLQRQADPVAGVLNWDRFEAAVRVLTVVPGEPRVALKIGDLQAILNCIDLADFYEVQFACLLLVLLFSFSRSECPCPKTLDGLDPTSHWLWRDFQMTSVSEVPALAVRFKKIKQDRRLERPAAAPTPDDAPGESGDWVYLGDVPGTIFSLVLWFTRLLAFSVPREPGHPMFLHRDRRQPLTYGAATDMLKVMQRRAGVSDKPGLHGIRVEGNNLSRNANGDELTNIHGGWLSAAGRSRYDRFSVADVVAIPARMVGRPHPGGEGAATPRDILRFQDLDRRGPQAGDPVQFVRAPVIGGTSADPPPVPPAPVPPAPRPPAPAWGLGPRPTAVADLDGDPRGAGVLLPSGYTTETRLPDRPRSENPRPYKVYVAPDGATFRSRTDAWRHEAATLIARARDGVVAAEAVAPAGGPSPTASPSSTPPESPRNVDLFERPPTPTPRLQPTMAQSTRARAGPSSVMAVAPAPHRGRGTRLRANLR